MMTSFDTSALVERWLPFYEDAHAHPEPGMREFTTTNKIEVELDRLGIEHFRVSETGTVGIVRNGEGPVIAFRADIDGLPVTEDTGLSYASTDTVTLDGTTSGLMHACGHDTHFTSLLAALDFLVGNTDTWSGTLVAVFQPAEETGEGATAMVDGGLWDRAPRPDLLLGQHVMPLPAGTIALRGGNAMNLADSLRVVVHGTQAHGSRPDQSIDPIVTAAAMITRLQTIVSREIMPGTAVVITSGMINGGTAPNIIPDSCTFTLNIRTPSEDVRETVLAAIERIVNAEAQAARATVDISTIMRFPRCYNDPAATERIHRVLTGAFNEASVMLMPSPLTGSEDVGALADAIDVPMVYWFFGGHPAEAFAEGAEPAGNHSPFFAPDGRGALTTGITAAISTLLDTLTK